MTGSDVGDTAVPRRPRLRTPSRPALVVLVVALVCTGVLCWLCRLANQRNEHRLLDMQTKQTGTVLQVVIPTIETPLASAAEIAATSGGDTTDFRGYVQDYVGEKGPFVSASLWRLGGAAPAQLTSVGRAPQLGGRTAGFLAEAAQHAGLHVTGPLGAARPTLGYAFSAGSGTRYVVYAESALPPGRVVTTQPGSPFGDLDFALYLGRSANPRALLETNSRTLPLPGHTATVVIPFGTSALTLVAAANTQLGGHLLGWLWWIVGLIGVLLAVVAALITENLVRRRLAAEQLTADVAHLLNEQRTIAETLQHALLPRRLPRVPRLEIAARYLPGSNDVEIGGDWYDAIPVDGSCCFVVVGDVSGRGVEAGTVMAALNFAIRGFVSEGHDPASILGKLTRLLDLRQDGHFATVLCGLLDVARRELTLASAGHLPPLLVSENHAEYLPVPVGPPIGVAPAGEYRQATIEVPRAATLLAFTDGLVERRDENIDAGLARLQHVAAAGGPGAGTLEDLVGGVVAALLRNGNEDDTAVLGVRWRT